METLVVFDLNSIRENKKRRDRAASPFFIYWIFSRTRQPSAWLKQ